MAEAFPVGKKVSGSTSFMYSKNEGCPIVVPMIDAGYPNAS